MRTRMMLRWILLAACPVIVTAQSATTRPISVAPRTIDLDLAPAVEFDPGSVDFHRVERIISRADGSVVVANGGSLQLLIFDRTGALVRAVGGKGSGPGEYSELWSVDRLPGDSIVVLDRYQRRVTILAPNGTYARSFNIVPPFAGGGSPNRLVALPSGELLLGYSEVRTMAPSPEAQQFRERLFVYRASGEVKAGPGISLLGSEHFTQAVSAASGVAYWSRTFGRVLTIRAVSGGFVAGDGTEWAVDAHRLPDGSITARHRVAREVARVTPSEIAAERKHLLSTARADRVALFEKMFDEMPYPETMPAYARFEMDELERVWVEEYSPPAARPRRQVWVRVDTRTRRQAIMVRFPDSFQPLAFARGHVFGVWRDADDVQHVRAYALSGLP